MVLFNIYVIHESKFKTRFNLINNTLTELKKICDKIGNIEVKINFILENKEVDNSRIKYDKYPDETDNKELNSINTEFNNRLIILNEHVISNIERHRIIYDIIAKSNDNNDVYHLVLEDDALISSDYISNIEETFKNIANKTFEKWDILFTCLPSMKQNNKLEMNCTKDFFKILMNKSSYFIKKNICKDLYDFTNTIKFSHKDMLSRFIYENPKYDSMFLNKNLILEGSKIGIVPTTINNNNFLFQNNNYINLINISNKEKLEKKDIEESERIYDEASKQFLSADMMHIMGIVYFKYNDYDNAKDFFNKALENTKMHNGSLYQSSELLNNTINIYQFNQEYLEECKKMKSKYSI